MPSPRPPMWAQCVTRLRIRRQASLSEVCIAALMPWRVWRAFSRPSAKRHPRRTGFAMLEREVIAQRNVGAAVELPSAAGRRLVHAGVAAPQPDHFPGWDGPGGGGGFGLQPQQADGLRTPGGTLRAETLLADPRTPTSLFEWALERSGRRDWSVLLPALLKGSLTCHLPSRAPYADLVESHRACSGEESAAFGGSSFRILFPRRQRDTTRLE